MEETICQTDRTLSLYVAAVPVPQPRQRVRVVQPKNGKKPFAQNYTPTSDPVNALKASVRAAFSAKSIGAPTDESIQLKLTFVMPRPSQMVWKTKPMPRVPYTAKINDWDNLGKAVCDALNKIAWTDDGRIWDARVIRWIAAGDEAPHVEIEITKETPWELITKPF